MLLAQLTISEIPPWLLCALSVEELRHFLERLRMNIAARALP